VASNINLKDALLEADEKYEHDIEKLFGYALLGFPQNTDSSRQLMFASHEKQYLVLDNPDIPRVQTGYENAFGKRSSGYLKLDGEWEVQDVIRKYDKGQVITIVLYNKDTDTYDMIESPVVENLTEKFGFTYDTSVIDSLKPGDTVKDQILYKSTSYDKYMNYRYGKNAKIYFSTSPDTLEDALTVRRGWAEQIQTTESDTAYVTVNVNDVFINLYGDDENYKILPDIGEEIKDCTLCVTRRVNSNHILFDFQASRMREISSTDEKFFVSEKSKIYDMNIYFNGGENFPDNVFYAQLKELYDQQNAYAAKVYEWADKIKKSKSKYDLRVSLLRARYKNWNNPEWKWKWKDKVFGFMLIEFHVCAKYQLEEGSKISGRYGNKGVVSRLSDKIDLRRSVVENFFNQSGKEPTEKEITDLMERTTIVDDDKMPYTDKFPVDILLNMSGSIRRLNVGQLYEVELNFIAREIQDKIKSMKKMEDKVDLILKFLEMVNKDQGAFFRNMYDGFSEEIDVDGAKVILRDKHREKNFVESVERDGFYLVVPPGQVFGYNSLKNMYKAFPWIKPYPMYINLFGKTKRRVIKDGIVGDMYMLILKQNSSKQFSARSTFRLNRAGLPAKDTAKKSNKSSYSSSPIRLSEVYNLLASISGEDMAEYNIFMRSSVLGRKSLDRILKTEGNPLDLPELKIEPDFLNNNVELLNARFKSLGIKLKFCVDGEDPNVHPDTLLAPIYVDGMTIYDCEKNKPIYIKTLGKYKKYKTEHGLNETARVSRDTIWNWVFEQPDIQELHIPEKLVKTIRNLKT
jgi:hypothetical protein